MDPKVPHRNQPLEGVICSVNNCYYNSNGRNCTASNIEIKSPDAVTEEETDCATFTMK